MEIVDTFYQYCRLQNLSQRTIVGIRSALNIYARHVSNIMNPTDKEVFDFFVKGKEKGFSDDKPSGAWNYNNIRKYLNKFYKWAIEYKHITYNPITKIPAQKIPKQLPRRLDRDSTMKILYYAQNYDNPSKYLKARNYAIVATLLITGLRAQELLHLKNEDINFKEHAIRVIHGKGDKERYVYFTSTLSPILKDYIAEKERVGKESIYFFVSYGSNMKLSYRDLQVLLSKISQRAGVKCTSHQLRHTCFSTMVEQNIDLPSIQAQAGHTSIATTQIYLHVSSQHRKSVMEKVCFF